MSTDGKDTQLACRIRGERA
uniref:Uncharacterized protein n=1 Tax=Heterorhabditis bacteriophora TaxID=37862 RepID=A0A1I7WES5_HETBA